jgi:peptidoglycan/xylan/chitin deacetylase (PgdA/CDA1 family)
MAMDRFTSNGWHRRCLALMYHEILAASRGDAGREPPKGANIYKLGERDFREQMQAIALAVGRAGRLGRVDAGDAWVGPRPVFLTFDDGEASALTIVADLIESYGWRGHFFITTDFIGQPGFLNRGEIAELDRRGHLIGSHSCSHPVPMSRCSPAQLEHEWRDSAALLADITGAPVRVASVPGGYYSRVVAETAMDAGIRILFTSEPTERSGQVGECLVLGRYAIKRGMGSEVAAAFAAGHVLPRWRQAALWNAKKALKAANVRAYLRVRDAILGA